MSISWHGEDFKRKLKKMLEQRLTRVALMLDGYIKKLISVGNITGKLPSKPGEPPRVRTGTLRANIGYEIDSTGIEVIAYIGVRQGAASPYAKALEESGLRDGTTRPYLRPAIEHNRVKILAIVGGK